MQDKKIHMRFNSYILFTLAAIFLFAAVCANAECLQYEPHTVTVLGVIKKETLPGPPNYESIAKGDRPEIFWILVLDKPVCVKANESDPLNKFEDNIFEMQMVLNTKQYDSFHKLLYERVKIIGKLFHAHTGHHHKQVLIRVMDIKKAA